MVLRCFSTCSGVATMISTGVSNPLKILRNLTLSCLGDFTPCLITKRSTSLSRVSSPRAMEPNRIILSGELATTILLVISASGIWIDPGLVTKVNSKVIYTRYFHTNDLNHPFLRLDPSMPEPRLPARGGRPPAPPRAGQRCRFRPYGPGFRASRDFSAGRFLRQAAPW